MNFIAIIGIVEIKPSIKTKSENVQVNIKVEKPFLETQDEEWYDVIPCRLDKAIFINELCQMSQGSIVGIKGRIQTVNGLLSLIGERVQVF